MGCDNKEYIDVNDALKRVGGNEGLYKKLLGQFIDSDHIGSLEKALSANNMETAAREAHSIKGISANLSLPMLNKVAAALEQKIKNGEDYAEGLKELKETFDATSEHIKVIIEE